MSTSLDRAILVHSSVRPARVLVLVPDSMAYWAELMLLLAEQTNILWGSRWTLAAAPVTEDHRIPSPFVELARLFDPDYVVKFGPSLGDFRRYEIPNNAIAQIRTQLENDDLFTEESFARLLHHQTVVWPQTEGPVIDHVMDHLPTFDYLTGSLLQAIRPTEDPGYPFTSLPPYVEGSASLPPMAAFDVQIEDPALRLLTAWGPGVVTNALRNLWTSNGGSVVDIPLFAADNTSGSYDLVWGALRTPYEFRQYEASLGTTVPEAAPAVRTMLECAIAIDPGTPRRILQSAALGVVGDELSDFLLWLLLSRLRSGVYWIPVRTLNASFRGKSTNPAQHFARHLTTHARMSNRGGGHQRMDLTTASLSPQRLGTARTQLSQIDLRAVDEASLIDDSHIAKTAEDLLSLMHPRLYAVEKQGHRSPAVINLDQEGISVGPLPSPPPASSTSRFLGSKRWMVEYDLGIQLPPFRRLANSMLDAITKDTGRITAQGDLAVFHPHFMVVGGATVDDTWTLHFKPPPQGVELIQELLRDSFHVDLMDKGRYYSELLRRIPFEELLPLIDDEGFAKVASSLLRRSSDLPIIWDGTIAAAELEQATKILTTGAESLLRAGLLQLVHAVKCRVCRNLEIRRIADIDREMTCRRCESAIRLDDLTAESFFRTQRISMNGLLQEFLDQRSDSVLTAFKLAGTEPDTALLPEIVVTSDPDQYNIDLVAVDRGEVVLGEVKTGRTYLSNQACRKYTRRMETMADVIAPVRLRVVHAWTGDLTGKSRYLRSDRFSTQLITIPHRPWYASNRQAT